MITKPMLAGKVTDFSKIKYPVLATPKLDGIRCVIIDGKPLTRTFKPVPNVFINEKLQGLPNNLDGELMVKGDFSSVQSAVMDRKGQPDFTYNVFDYVKESPYSEYAMRMLDLDALMLPAYCEKVLPIRINNEEELMKLEEEVVANGYEGLMIRSPNSPYKMGRSSEREGYLLKIKRFEDAEGTIVGFTEKMHNENKPEEDAFGRIKRSTRIANLTPAGVLGAIELETTLESERIRFEVGTGFTEKERAEIWAERDSLIGKIVTFKYQGIGSEGRPRFPVFKGFRSNLDVN